jgi:hyperosmotically inducible periplasmic protein
MKKIIFLGVCAGFIAALGCHTAEKKDKREGRNQASMPAGGASVERNATNTASAAKEPDNTAQNVRDRSTNSVTAQDQSNRPEDREITRQLRRAIVKNGHLSFEARNIKIITINGRVTVRGPVKNEQERQTIENFARNIAGVTKVDDQLDVTQGNSSTHPSP